MKNELTYEQETVRSVFGAYINDLKAYSSKPDRPTFRKLEEVRDKAIQALESQRWIPVSERLPEENGYYLLSATSGEVQKDYYWDGEWNNADIYGYKVIAWMPLPEPYTESEEEG